MQFMATEDQAAFIEAARAFADGEMAPYAARWDAEKIFPVETLRAAADLGFAALYVREEMGGTGLTRLDAALIFEQLSQACPSTAAYLSIHNMVSWMVDRFGSDDQRARWLPQLTTMDAFSSYCLTEPGAGSDAAALATKAVKTEDGWVLSGQKAFISGGGRSDLYLVMARTGGARPKGISAFLVPAETPGLECGAQEVKMGWNSQPTAALYFRDCVLPGDALLGEEGQGFSYAMAGLDGGRVNIGACSLGGAQAALAAAQEYVSERKQFGQMLSGFQHIRFELADMDTELEAARLLLYRAADALDRKDPQATKLCAMAKRLATDTGYAVCDRALQLFGGYGYLRDYPVERLLRDLRVHRILEGTNEIMRLIIARSLPE